MTKTTIPDYIYLQVYGNEDPANVGDDETLYQISWSADKQFEADVKYVKADKALGEIARLRSVLKSLSETMQTLEREDWQNAPRYAALRTAIDRQIYSTPLNAGNVMI